MATITANTIVNKALSFVGVKESPINSNNVRFNTDYYGRPVSGNAYPWCCVFVWDVFRMCNASALFYGGNKTASCTTLMRWAKSVGRWHTSGYKPGDVVLYNFDKNSSDSEHTGIVYAVHNGYIEAIEGNTSPDNKGSQSNGGMVCIKKRVNSLILGTYRPDYKTEKNGSTATVSTSKPSKNSYNTVIANGQKAANKFVGCNIAVDGVYGSETRKAAIKVVQTALNKDYNAKLSVDGIWGSATDKAFGSHYVKVGETQWMVTALEILCAMKGKNPNGIEYPGTFGQGLKKACGVSKAVKSTFKNLCS